MIGGHKLCMNEGFLISRSIYKWAMLRYLMPKRTLNEWGDPVHDGLVGGSAFGHPKAKHRPRTDLGEPQASFSNKEKSKQISYN